MQAEIPEDILGSRRQGDSANSSLDWACVIADGVPSFDQAYVLLSGVAGATHRKDYMILIVRCGSGHGCGGWSWLWWS